MLAPLLCTSALSVDWISNRTFIISVEEYCLRRGVELQERRGDGFTLSVSEMSSSVN